MIEEKEKATADALKSMSVGQVGLAQLNEGPSETAPGTEATSTEVTGDVKTTSTTTTTTSSSSSSGGFPVFGFEVPKTEPTRNIRVIETNTTNTTKASNETIPVEDAATISPTLEKNGTTS